MRAPLVIDLDATLVTVHSEKDQARPTFKKRFGFHPLLAFDDHGSAGGGEMLASLLRPGNAGSNTATDHATVISDALNQARFGSRPGKKVLIRIDGGGSTKKTLQELVKRRVSYSVGYTLPTNTPELYRVTPERVWERAYDPDGTPREGADVAELTGLMDQPTGPKRCESSSAASGHAGAQLRFEDVDGYRPTAFATNTAHGQLADLEVRHRRRARCEDRIPEATVTPEDLDHVANVAEHVDAEVTLVLDLGHDHADRAADMAAHAQDAFGHRLLAVTIGNEPNGFVHENQPQLAVRHGSWGPEPYQPALREYPEALPETALGISVVGPGAYDATWWRAFGDSGIPDQRALTMHWYPLWACTGPEDSIENPTIEDLASPAQRERVRHIVVMEAEIAYEHDLPLWVEDTGPTSCPGTNDPSRTHAQALWTVDYAMTLAEVGVERAAFHSTPQA